MPVDRHWGSTRHPLHSGNHRVSTAQGIRAVSLRTTKLKLGTSSAFCGGFRRPELLLSILSEQDSRGKNTGTGRTTASRATSDSARTRCHSRRMPGVRAHCSSTGRRRRGTAHGTTGGDSDGLGCGRADTRREYGIKEKVQWHRFHRPKRIGFIVSSASNPKASYTDRKQELRVLCGSI